MNKEIALIEAANLIESEDHFAIDVAAEHGCNLEQVKDAYWFAEALAEQVMEHGFGDDEPNSLFD